jgi:hypothetical protein
MGIVMNGESGTGSRLEMRWHWIVEAGKSKRQCRQLEMKWVAIASASSRLSI